MSLDALLDMTLDDLADLPAFEVFPEGAHKVTLVSLERKEINKHPSIEARFKLIEHLELTNPEAKQMAVGSECSIAYMMDNEFGQGAFKAFVTPLAQHLGMSKLGDVMDAVKGMEVMIVTKQRQNKEKTATYLDVKSISVV